MADPTPDDWYAEGWRLVPAWGDDAPDVEARRDRALALITRAAEHGQADAVARLASGFGGPATFDWAVALARMGDVGPLVSALTDADWPPERGLGVLAAARDGAPWAMLAVGEVYGLGMRDNATGEPVAARDGGWGWLPGVPDPAAAARDGLERAAATGWAAAHLALAFDDQRSDPPRARAAVEAALAPGGTLTPKQRKMAGKLLATLLERTGAPAAERVAAWSRLAEGGDADAAVALGDLLRAGREVPKDLPRARALYEQAAAAGSVDGNRELGRMCERGHGGPRDLARAQALYEQAAELGADPYARERLVKKFGLRWYARGADEEGGP